MANNDDLIQQAKDLLDSAARVLEGLPEAEKQQVAVAAALAEVGVGFAVLASGHAVAKQVHGVRDALVNLDRKES